MSKTYSYDVVNDCYVDQNGKEVATGRWEIKPKTTINPICHGIADVRDAALEEAAQVADAYVNEPIATAIRALKGEATP